MMTTSFILLTCCALLPLSAAIDVEWAWTGALTSHGVRVNVKLDPTTVFPRHGLATVYARTLSRDETRSSVVRVGDLGDAGIAHLRFDDLPSGREYVYETVVEQDGVVLHNRTLQGRFTLPPQVGSPFNFTFAAASCADNQSDSKIFDLIRETNPLFFLHTGDLHYGNIARNDIRAYREMYSTTFRSPRQNAFFRQLPVSYIWDDHDFGPNNSHGGSPGRQAAIDGFLETVPHYPLAAYAAAFDEKRKPSLYYTFDIGRVRFLVTDLVSSKVKRRTMLGEEQLAWFKNQLAVAAADERVAITIWVSTMPWVSEHSKWGEFPDERQDIVRHIESLEMSHRMYIVAGDAHMLAFDDGSNSPGGVATFQAAAIDAKATSKGGPYSHGIFPGRGQYGEIQVQDWGGDRVCVQFTGFRMHRQLLRNPDAQVKRPTKAMIQYNTCNPGASFPSMSFIPSPPWIEKIWKRGKALFQGTPLWLFVVFVDSSSYSLWMVLKVLVSRDLVICEMVGVVTWLLLSRGRSGKKCVT